MNYDTRIEGEADKARQLLERYIAKGEVVTVKKKDCNRTLSQNNYLYYILSFFSDETGYSIDEVKVLFFKRQCNADIFTRVRTNKRGETVQYLRSSSELTKDEMSLAITRFRHWAASQPICLYIPSPEDKDFVRYCETKINNEQFNSVAEE